MESLHDIFYGVVMKKIYMKICISPTLKHNAEKLSVAH